MPDPKPIYVGNVVNRLPCVQNPGGVVCYSKRELLDLKTLTQSISLDNTKPVAVACLGCLEFIEHNFQPDTGYT